jgi:hypothetical protein
MNKIKKTVKKINNFFTVFLLFSSFFKTVKKINNFFSVFSRNSVTKSNHPTFVYLILSPITQIPGNEPTSIFFFSF